MFILAILAAATVAGGSEAPKKTPEMVQLTKTVCKGAANSADIQTPVCRGSNSRISSPVDCFCDGGYQKHDVPACWPDGTPVEAQGQAPECARVRQDDGLRADRGAPVAADSGAACAPAKAVHCRQAGRRAGAQRGAE